MKHNMENLVKNRKVLVVEDNEMNREILCALLEDDYEVLEAENGLVGLEQLKLHSADISIILLDVYMPELDGFGFLAEKEKDSRWASIPVIMMTASDSVDDEIRCLSLGATDFVTKPYNIQVLKNRMESVIRLRESASMLNNLEMDDLTQLYSKEFFYHNAAEYVNAHPDSAFDIVCSDIENFRAMNERYGRERCDAFLVEIADWLKEHLPGLIIGGRIDADVFAFLLEHQESDWTGMLTAKEEDHGHMSFSLKYGIIQNIDPELDVSITCDRATLALGTIKGNYNQTVAWYDDKLRQDQLRDHRLVEDMHAAIERRDFKIYYQPKHDLREDATGGAEALVRWIHPELGFINPGVFIPLFERNGFITQLDYYIWEEVCRELKKLKDEGMPLVPVSINASRMDFDVPNLAEQISELADRYGVDHSLLHIELTESIYGDNPDSIARTLEELHERGFYIELDDFGSGYSSLSSLNTLRLDYMKLDMSLIRQASKTKDYSIMRFCTLLADGMRLKTVAEGVESEGEVEALKVLGCDYIQGYFFSRPLPVDEFEKYLAEHAAHMQQNDLTA